MQVANKSTISMEAGLPAAAAASNPYEVVRQLAECNAVVVFSMSGCCMCTVVKRLLFGLGVGPTVVELDHLSLGPDIEAVLHHLRPGPPHQPIPAVFVGGKFLGGVETLMSSHINGTLVPLLKQAGALGSTARILPHTLYSQIKY